MGDCVMAHGGFPGGIECHNCSVYILQPILSCLAHVIPAMLDEAIPLLMTRSFIHRLVYRSQDSQVINLIGSVAVTRRAINYYVTRCECRKPSSNPMQGTICFHFYCLRLKRLTLNKS